MDSLQPKGTGLKQFGLRYALLLCKTCTRGDASARRLPNRHARAGSIPLHAYTQVLAGNRTCSPA